MANGRVITGYSDPWVATYAASGTTVTYSGAQALGRGVSVAINPDTATDNKFYADNVEAENAGTTFGSGTLKSMSTALFAPSMIQLIMKEPAWSYR